jgi:hypothetical protein
MENYSLVYVDCKPDGIPFYVGKGSLARIKNTKRNKHHSNICSKYPDWYRGIAFANSESDCNAKEIELIAKFGRNDLGQGTLVNWTNGGEGTVGHKHSCETKQKMSLSHKEYKWTQEHKDNNSIARRGVRKPLSSETKAKLSIVNSVPWNENRRKSEINRKVNSNSSSGINGISWDKSRQKWSIKTRIYGILYRLGRFNDLEEAKQALNSLKEQHGYL